MLVDFRWFRLELMDVFVKMKMSFHPVFEYLLRIHRSVFLFDHEEQIRRIVL